MQQGDIVMKDGWLKTFQSVGRGFRPGMEVKMLSGTSDTGKSVFIDTKSEAFKPWRETMRPHYAEYYSDTDTGETYWKKFNRQPKLADIYTALNVIRSSEDGTYEYVKNRATGELCKVPEENMAWIILAARKF